MNRHQLFQQIVCFGLILIFLVGCSTPATPLPPTFTPTAIPPTFTPTAIPPTFTSTAIPPTSTSSPVPSTPTLSSSAGPKAGHWEGEPSVSFDVTSDSKVVNFKMVYPMANGECHFDIKEIAIEEDNTFVFNNLMAPNQIKDTALLLVKIVAGEPEIIKTDTGDMIVLERIIGKFEDGDALTGTGKIWLCETITDDSTSKGIEWNAEWKTP